MKIENTWFIADYTDAEGNKIKKRSNEKIYKELIGFMTIKKTNLENQSLIWE